ncbi:uncharacterized protein LOC144337124 [Macaca mulatta]
MSCPGLQGRDQAPSGCYDSRGEGGEGPEEAAHTWAGAVSSAAAIGLCGRSGTREEVLIPGRAGVPRAPPNLGFASVQRGRLLLRLLSQSRMMLTHRSAAFYQGKSPDKCQNDRHEEDDGSPAATARALTEAPPFGGLIG